MRKSSYLNLFFLILYTSLSSCEGDLKKENLTFEVDTTTDQTDTQVVFENPISKGETSFKNTEIQINTFKVDNIGNGGWGYDILVAGKLYIHQPIMPAINGSHPFPTEERALKVGEFVANKIRNNVLPPTITIEELKTLGAI